VCRLERAQKFLHYGGQRPEVQHLGRI
jgi:hypothetical protein